MEDFKIIYSEEIELTEEEKKEFSKQYVIEAEYGKGEDDDVND